MDISVEEAKKQQIELAKRVIIEELRKIPQIIWGVDVSFPLPDWALGVVVVLKAPSMETIKVSYAFKKVTFPYIPGLLSFRETPVILEAADKIKQTFQPDLIFVDGNGILHPRRFGIASHIGIIFDTPTIGVAKTLLCGKVENKPQQKGQATNVTLNGEIIGKCLKTQDNCEPVFVSIGNRITLQEAVWWVVNTSRYRLPEPIRLADFFSKKFKNKKLF